MNPRKKAACTRRRHGEESHVSPTSASIFRTRPLRPVSGSESHSANGPEIGRSGGSLFFRFLKNGKKRFSRIMTGGPPLHFCALARAFKVAFRIASEVIVAPLVAS